MFQPLQVFIRALKHFFYFILLTSYFLIILHLFHMSCHYLGHVMGSNWFLIQVGPHLYSSFLRLGFLIFPSSFLYFWSILLALLCIPYLSISLTLCFYYAAKNKDHINEVKDWTKRLWENRSLQQYFILVMSCHLLEYHS